MQIENVRNANRKCKKLIGGCGVFGGMRNSDDRVPMDSLGHDFIILFIARGKESKLEMSINNPAIRFLHVSTC